LWNQANFADMVGLAALVPRTVDGANPYRFLRRQSGKRAVTVVKSRHDTRELHPIDSMRDWSVWDNIAEYAEFPSRVDTLLHKSNQILSVVIPLHNIDYIIKVSLQKHFLE
jgi:hypothetical protein